MKTLNENSWNRNKYVGYLLRAFLFRSSTKFRQQRSICQRTHTYTHCIPRLGECLLERRRRRPESTNTSARCGSGWQPITAMCHRAEDRLQGDRDAGRGERSSRDAFLALDSFNEEDMTASVEGPMGDHTMTGAPDPKASSKQLLLR